MTYEEALNQDIKMTDEYAKNDLERYLLRKEEPIPKSVALGMKALEKQIPKKPKGVYCPSCGFDCDSDAQSPFPKYCQNCGQALDYGEEK